MDRFLFLASGDAKRESDWDILILADYPVSTEIERSFRNNLFDIEIETGEVFSTFVYQKQIWNTKHKMTTGPPPDNKKLSKMLN